jgi:hypothetical protein
VPGAAPWTIQQPLEAIRTDLDVFSQIEAEELMRHGYFRSERVVGSRGGNRPEFAMDGKAAAHRARQLVSGSRRKRRFLNRRDWVTWAQCACLLLLAIATSYVVPPTVEASRVEYFKFRGLAIIDRPLPEWTRPALPPEPIIVPSLQPPANAGFRVIREERVWDLRALKRDASGKIVGPARMQRNTFVIRESPDAKEYVYWFQTSGHQFSAWSLNREFPIQIRTQMEPVIDGPSRMKAEELRIDVSQKRLYEKFLLTVQAESYDAFAEPDQWWIGMRMTDRLDEASMRIVFPKDLHYRNPEFTKYPNNTAVRETFEGQALDSAQPQEILWWVPNAPQGMTYRVQWKW